jgi:hypothetical protein
MVSKTAQLLRHVTIGAAPFWWSILPVVWAVGFFALWRGFDATSFRYSGLSLQILGLGFVWRAVQENLRTFGKKPLRERAGAWVSTLFVLLKRSELKPVSGTISGSVGLAIGGSAALSVSRGPRTVEEHLAELDAEVRGLHTRMAAAEKASSAEFSLVRQEIKKEGSAREQSHTELRGLVEAQAIGGWHFDIAGLVWLAFGTLFAGIPDEIAALIRLLFGR